jgi:hypothetical protein
MISNSTADESACAGEEGNPTSESANANAVTKRIKLWRVVSGRGDGLRADRIVVVLFIV